MALLNISIPIPDERITFKKAREGKARYVYHVVKRYRNKHGTPTAKEMMIGKEDPDRQGRMMPNENFTKYYPMPHDVISLAPKNDVWEAGHMAFFKMRAEKIGLVSALERAFPAMYEELLLIAIYMACEGNVMMNMDYFLQSSLVPRNLVVSPQRTSDVFAELTVDKQMAFFSIWKDSALREGETVAYDVTSLSTYADLPLAEYGYNRDRESLPQLNVGVLYGTDSDLPISFFLYSGSLVDKVFFSKMLQHCESMSIEEVFYVLDRGFLTQSNLTFLKDRGIDFLMAVPKSQKIYKTVMQEESSRLRRSACHIRGGNCYGTQRSMEIHGEPYALYIYLNTKSAADEEMTLFSHIDRLEEELKAMKKPASLSRYKKYYKVEGKKEAVIQGYERDHEKIDEALALLGVFAYLSNKENLTAEEALKLYARRDLVEKAFDRLKNELDHDRFLTHNHSTTTGKSFVSFLSLILWSDLTSTMRNKPKLEKTVGRLIKELRTVKRIDRGEISMLLQPLTKKQKDILEAFDIPIDDFIEQILSVKV